MLSQDLLNVATIASGSTVMGGIIAKAFEKVWFLLLRINTTVRDTYNKKQESRLDFLIREWAYTFFA